MLDGEDLGALVGDGVGKEMAFPERTPLDEALSMGLSWRFERRVPAGAGC